jgi:uncharacterized membrane protein HdeD (DUF308 family)
MAAASTLKRPPAITGIGLLFIVAGLAGLASQLWHADRADRWWVIVSGTVALLGGILLLARYGWVRWILVAWLAFHVWISVGAEAEKLVIHAALFLLITWLLFRRSTAEWLRGGAAARS